MHMYVYECACVRMLHFETRKRLNCACIYVILLYATPPSACFVCIPTIVLGYWPCRPRIRAYACICVRVCVSYRSICRDHGLGQIPRWIPTCRVALYFVYMPELPGSNNAEKPDTHTHMSVCVCLSKPAQGAPRLICLCALWWVAATVRTRCGLSNCPAKMLLLLLLLLENDEKYKHTKYM